MDSGRNGSCVVMVWFVMVWFVMVWFVMVWFFVFMADEVLLLYMRPTSMSRGIQEFFYIV